jgi:hypothetical protein
MTEFPRAVLSDDTSLSAEQWQVRRSREMSIAEKGRLVTSLCQVADAMALCRHSSSPSGRVTSRVLHASRGSQAWSRPRATRVPGNLCAFRCPVTPADVDPLRIAARVCAVLESLDVHSPEDILSRR